MWDNSCLEGTLVPVLCEHTTNRTQQPFRNCLSALYKLSIKGGGGKEIVIFFLGYSAKKSRKRKRERTVND